MHDSKCLKNLLLKKEARFGAQRVSYYIVDGFHRGEPLNPL